jgi:hypothetical protein
MSEPERPEPRCAGQPPLCPGCSAPLVADPTGPWCRRCRRAYPGSPPHLRCAHPPIATGNTPRTGALRLCRRHARLLVDAAGPGAVILEDPPR